ncbi:MAG TPA: DUF2207 domain-containing protein, partial [Nocardioides sp.]|uniref:DUF2207 domain-containing protein n=1 Tax=Nocardioides sp. TaxID=35761 RepID=UPI002C4566A7
MLRIVARVVGLLLLLVGVGAWAIGFSASSDTGQVEETTISSYVATFDVDSNGDMEVVERLRVNFPFPGKHGIFRFFDVRDDNDWRARRIPESVTVSRDGGPEQLEMLTEGRGRYRVAKIGSPYSTLEPGIHTYEIRYRIEGVLLPGPDNGTSRFYWNLIPGGWQQPIEKARLTVRLPAETSDVLCAVGAGRTTGCTASGEGTDTLLVRVGSLAPRTPVTLRTDVAVATPESGNALLWPQRFDPVLGRSVPLLVLVVSLSVAAGVAGYWVSRRTRETPPAYPLQYAPPEGIGPAQARYLMTETLDHESYVASVMQAAEKGAVGLDRVGEDWRITDKAGPAGWAGVDEVTAEVAGLLSGPHTSFLASRHDVEAGKRLKQEISSLQSHTHAWARRQGLMVSSGIGCLGGLLVVGAAILAGIVCFTNPLKMSVLALVPGLFALGALEVLVPGASTKRTAAGRELWSRIGGFHRILSTPSSVQRFEFSGRQELYTAYLPWAVAFGCAAQWAEKYRTEMGAEPPVPSYFPTGYGLGATGFADSLVHDFSSTVDSAISAYEATQRSSSSSGGGGGFSGGGGGG